MFTSNSLVLKSFKNLKAPLQKVNKDISIKLILSNLRMYVL